MLIQQAIRQTRCSVKKFKLTHPEVPQPIARWTGWSRDFPGGICPIANPQPVSSLFALRGLDHGLTSQFARIPNLLSRAGQQYTRGYAGTQ
jgi:hypothetical protein